MARRIASLPRYLYASPGYLRRAPALEHPDDLAGHAPCGRPVSGGQFSARHSLRRGGETVTVTQESRFVTNGAAMALTMAANDLCIAVLDPRLVRHEVAAGRLLRVLPEWQAEPVEVHVITDTRHLPARSKLFIAFLKERLAEPFAGDDATAGGVPGRRDDDEVPKACPQE